MAEPTPAADNAATNPEASSTDTNTAKGEVRGTLLSPDQVSDWGNETRIVEKNAKTEDGSEIKKPKAEVVAPAEEEKPAGSEKPAGEEKPAEPAPLPPEPVAPSIAIEDPGEFEPSNFSFEVTTYDQEGKNGRTRTINSIEQWDQLLDGDPNFGSAGSLLKAQRLATKMETGIERETAEYETKVEKYNEAVEAQQAEDTTLAGFISELNYLTQKGELPPIPAAYEAQGVNWSDPEIAKDPGVAARKELFDFMARENRVRASAGLPKIASILDAWNSFQLEQAKTGAAEAKTKAAEARKAAGARVAGSTPAPVGAAPKGISVGQGGSLRDIGENNWQT